MKLCKIYVKSRFYRAKAKPRKADVSEKRPFCAVYGWSR